jgi:RES domain-containing protein
MRAGPRLSSPETAPVAIGVHWNSKELKAIYLADSLALATLEIMAHAITYDNLRSYEYFEVRFSEELSEIPGPQSLLRNWRKDPTQPDCKQCTNTRLAPPSKPVLKIPTVVLPDGCNFVINPDHTDFAHIEISASKPFILDDRITRNSSA